MIGTVNLIPLAINKIEGNHVPYIPSSDWARNKFLVQSDQQYSTGKLLGGTGLITLATAGLGAAAGGTGAAASQTGTIVVQAEGQLAVAAAGTAVPAATAAAVGGLGVGAIGQTVQMSVGNAGGNAPNNAQVVGEKPASAPVGSRGQQVPSIEGNPPTTINGRQFSGHAVDRMQGRGLVPSYFPHITRGISLNFRGCPECGQMS